MHTGLLRGAVWVCAPKSALPIADPISGCVTAALSQRVRWHLVVQRLRAGAVIVAVFAFHLSAMLSIRPDSAVAPGSVSRNRVCALGSARIFLVSLS